MTFTNPHLRRLLVEGNPILSSLRFVEGFVGHHCVRLEDGTEFRRGRGYALVHRVPGQSPEDLAVRIEEATRMLGIELERHLAGHANERLFSQALVDAETNGIGIAVSDVLPRGPHGSWPFFHLAGAPHIADDDDQSPGGPIRIRIWGQLVPQSAIDRYFLDEEDMRRAACR